MQIKKSYIITLTLYLFLFTISYGQNKTKVADLKGLWKFSIGNNEKWSSIDYNDSGWENIQAPSAWEKQGFYGYNGYAFYRKEVVIPSNFEGQTFIIRLGYIDDVDETYFNGVVIGGSGKFPPGNQSAYNAFREYNIPANLINFDGKNIIAIKVFDTRQDGGIISGDLSIYATGMALSPDIDLQGSWKFKTGDNPSYKNMNYTDNSWDNVIVPNFWENQGYNHYDGYAWYRKTFTVNKMLKGDQLILLMGKIDDVDEVFLNGQFIGNTGIMSINHSHDDAWEELRGYYFSKDLLDLYGKNTVAVRVRDYGSGGGIYEGSVGIITMDNYIKYWRKKKDNNW